MPADPDPAAAVEAVAGALAALSSGTINDSGGAKSSCTLRLLLGFKQPTRGVTCSQQHSKSVYKSVHVCLSLAEVLWYFSMSMNH